jgi:transcription-repair coupling factor (superfamily II helicase)
MEDLQELHIELINRFGLLPTVAQTLFELTKLKLTALFLGVKKIRVDNTGGYLEFGENVTVDPDRLIRLIKNAPESFRLEGPFKIRIKWRLESDEDRPSAVSDLLSRLSTTDHNLSAAQ